MLQQECKHNKDIFGNLLITLMLDNTDIVILEEKKTKALLKALKEKAQKMGWTFNLTLIGSERKSEFAYKKYKKTGGRYKSEFILIENKLDIEYYKNDPHIHILLEHAQPYTSIRDYMFDYWKKREGNKTQKNKYTTWSDAPKDDKHISDHKVYMKNQSEFSRRLNMRHGVPYKELLTQPTKLH